MTRSSIYPPEHHVLRDLRFETERVDARHVRAFAPRQAGVCADDGSMRISAIAMAVDVAGAAVALLAATPDWSATADLGYWGARPLRTGPMCCDARLVRAGSGLIVVEADVFDACGDDAGIDVPRHVLAGRARMAFARIPAHASASAGRIDRSGAPSPRQGMHRADCTFDDDDLFTKTGIRTVDDAGGVVECPRSDYVRNSFGTINGGVIGVIAEAGAERAARHATGVALVARDLQVQYLSQTKVGPARTSCRVLRADARHAVVDVEIVDAGNADTVLALATVTFGAPDA